MSKSILNTDKYICYRCGRYGPTEIFKDIPGYDGKYLIGSRGTVLSTEFRNNSVQKKRIKEMIPTDNGNGYKIVFFRVNNKRKREYVHRLVANAFVRQTEGKNVVNHKDHDKSNNCASNLEWCTQQENVNYSANRMMHEKSKCKKTETGYKYIHLCKKKGKQKYRLVIRKKGSMHIDKTFDDLNRALTYRDEVINVKINS